MKVKYFFLVIMIAFANIFLLLYNFGVSEMKTKSMKYVTSTDCNMKFDEMMLKSLALLDELRAWIPHGQYVKHLQEIQAITGSGKNERDPDDGGNQVELQYSCPEVYKGSTFGYPYFEKGFVRENCKNRMNPSDSTTLILDRPQATNKQLKDIVSYAGNIFHTVIVVLHEKSNTTFFSNQNVIILRKNDDEKLGKLLNQAVKHVKTPLTLVAPFLSQFNNNSDIERLLHVLELSSGDIVGGSVKHDGSGEWDRGCYQMTLKLYTLKYKKGYMRSKYECLYCDYLISPFLTYTKQLENVPFDSNLPSSVYMDYFLRIHKKKNVILACPDVMFYSKRPDRKRIEMIDVVKKWNIKRIIDSENNVIWFGCRFQNGASCRRGLHTPPPPCCRSRLADAINFIQEQCTQHNITCELQEGTLMGAVKFNHVLPWEKDADITVLSSDFNKFAALKSVFRNHYYDMKVHTKPYCCLEGVISGGTMHIAAHGWMIEVYGQHKLTTRHQGVKTKVNFAGSWVNTPENPGLYLRNRYGREIYWHAEHWMTTGKSSGWSKYTPGKFRNCETPGDHTCLDQFDADGNIQFGGLL